MLYLELFSVLHPDDDLYRHSFNYPSLEYNTRCLSSKECKCVMIPEKKVPISLTHVSNTVGLIKKRFIEIQALKATVTNT